MNDLYPKVRELQAENRFLRQRIEALQRSEMKQAQRLHDARAKSKTVQFVASSPVAAGSLVHAAPPIVPATNYAESYFKLRKQVEELKQSLAPVMEAFVDVGYLPDNHQYQSFRLGFLKVGDIKKAKASLGSLATTQEEEKPTDRVFVQGQVYEVNSGTEWAQLVTVIGTKHNDNSDWVWVNGDQGGWWLSKNKLTGPIGTTHTYGSKVVVHGSTYVIDAIGGTRTRTRYKVREVVSGDVRWVDWEDVRSPLVVESEKTIKVGSKVQVPSGAMGEVESIDGKLYMVKNLTDGTFGRIAPGRFIVTFSDLKLVEDS
jgi:hypothetical protein